MLDCERSTYISYCCNVKKYNVNSKRDCVLLSRRCIQVLIVAVFVLSRSALASSSTPTIASRWIESYKTIVQWDRSTILDAINQTMDHSQVDQQLSVLPGILRVRGRKRKKRDKVYEVFDSVSYFSAVRRGSTSSPLSVTFPRNSTAASVVVVDEILGRIARILGGIVAFRSIGTLLTSNDHALLDKVAAKFLSAETAKAVQTVKQIITCFPDHGVATDVLSLYSPREVTTAIWALSRLQQASTCYQVADNPNTFVINDDVEPELVKYLARYAVFASAAYGWKGALAFRLKIHRGNLRAVLKKTGVEREHVITSHWASGTPAYFLVRDVAHRKLVLCIRGTLSARDILTDMCCTVEDFLPYDNDAILKNKRQINRAHHGMLESARGVACMTQKAIASELAATPNYQLVLIGHSLGGGVAAILGTLWKDTFPGLMVYTFGCPCVGPLKAHPTENYNIVSVVGEGDPFSCLSLGHIADLSMAISRLCENRELRNEILDRTQGRLDEISKKDLKWCAKQMQILRQCMRGEKLYPSGRILYMVHGSNEEVTLRQVSAGFFRDLTLHPRMFDLTRHAPGRYEAALQRLWSGNDTR